MRKHTLNAEGEEILAATADLAMAPSRIFEIFDSVDLHLPMIATADGTPVQLTKGNYSTFMQSGHRSERQAAYASLLEPYQAQQNTLAAILSAHSKQRIFFARQRRLGQRAQQC